MGPSDPLNNALRERPGWDASQYGSKLCFCPLQFIPMLTIEPELRGDAAESLQSRCHLGADGSVPGQNTVKRLACYAKISSRLTDGQLQAWKDVITQQRAGMFGLPGDRSPMSLPDHGCVTRGATAGSESFVTFRNCG
jgi:hypothetical protein